jgi:hypothetical protein
MGNLTVRRGNRCKKTFITPYTGEKQMKSERVFFLCMGGGELMIYTGFPGKR